MSSPTPVTDAAAQPSTTEARIADRLASLWTRQRPELAARVDVLERAAAAAADASLTPQLRAEAAALAHKLAGALGMYGYVSAGEAARTMERLLDATAPLVSADLQHCAAELRRVVAP